MVMKLKFYLSTVFMLLLVTGQAFALTHGKKSIEIAFDNAKLRNFVDYYESLNINISRLQSTKFHTEAKDRLQKMIKKVCGSDCRYKVVFDEEKIGILNWEIQHKLYPYLTILVKSSERAVNVTLAPMTTQEILRVKDEIQLLVWDAAKTARLVPSVKLATGSIQLDIRSHFGNPEEKGNAGLFRNFFVDLQNNPEIFNFMLGIDKDSILNFPSLATQGVKAQQAFREVLSRFDRYSKHRSIMEFATEVNKYVYKKATIKGEDYQAFNTKKIDRRYQYDKRNKEKIHFHGVESIDIKSIRSLKSSQEYVRMALLLDARLDLLSNKGPINYKGKSIDISDVSGEDFQQRIVDSFYRYVTETGLSYDDYKFFLPLKLRKIGSSN